MSESSIRERAQWKLAQLVRRRRDPRYGRVIGRLVHAGLLETNHPVLSHNQPIRVEDALWVGKVEPRVLELLPATLVKVPSMFVDATSLPADLAACVAALRRSVQPPDFRGVPGVKVFHWLLRVGRKNKFPSRLKSFRFQAQEQRLLERLSVALSLSESDVIRLALVELADRHFTRS
jgi:hypothetical protein